MNQRFVDETGVESVVVAEEPPPPPPPRLSSVTPVTYCPPVENEARYDDEHPAVGEENQVSFDSVVAWVEARKVVLPDMLRAQECIER